VDPEEITPGAAILNGHVDPSGNGDINECHFDYVTEEAFQATHYSDLSSGGTAPCEPPAPISAPADVTAALSGLHAATRYHVRLDAANAESAATAERTFETPAAVSLSTELASEVGSASATLNGTINPKGTELTECQFEWGETEDYGEVAPCEAPDAAEVGVGNAPVSVHADLAGLDPEATYHFRLVAANEFGIAQGADEFVGTLTVKPIIDSEGSSAVTQTAASLEAQINPNGSDTTCELEYGETESYGETAACSPADLGAGNSDQFASAEISALSPNTTYHYRFVATNSFGTREGSDRTLTTALPDPPSALTEGASVVTQTTAIVDGTINGQGAETKWLFNYGPTSGSGYPSQAPQSGGNAGFVSTDTPESVELTGLDPNTTYRYQMVDFNVGACFFTCPPTGPNTTFGQEETFTTLADPPLVFTGLSSGLSALGATVHGSITPQGDDTAYAVEYVSEAGYQEGAPDPYEAGSTTQVEGIGNATSAEAVAVVLSSLRPATTYHYRFAATNDGGTSSGDDQTFTTYGMAPGVETGAPSAVTANGAVLAGLVDPRGSATTYRFQYGTTGAYGANAPAPEADGGSGIASEEVSTALSGLLSGTSYHYRLVAINATGVSYGADRTFNTAAAVPTPVPAPHVPRAASATCRKGLVKKHGKCVKKPVGNHRKKAHNKRRHKRHAHNERKADR
jgi:phosphodiesterase/alkaline phosphatase D-like protein